MEPAAPPVAGHVDGWGVERGARSAVPTPEPTRWAQRQVGERGGGIETTHLRVPMQLPSVLIIFSLGGRRPRHDDLMHYCILCHITNYCSHATSSYGGHAILELPGVGDAMRRIRGPRPETCVTSAPLLAKSLQRVRTSASGAALALQVKQYFNLLRIITPFLRVSTVNLGIIHKIFRRSRLNPMGVDAILHPPVRNLLTAVPLAVRNLLTAVPLDYFTITTYSFSLLRITTIILLHITTSLLHKSLLHITTLLLHHYFTITTQLLHHYYIITTHYFEITVIILLHITT